MNGVRAGVGVGGRRVGACVMLEVVLFFAAMTVSTAVSGVVVVAAAESQGRGVTDVLFSEMLRRSERSL